MQYPPAGGEAPRYRAGQRSEGQPAYGQPYPAQQYQNQQYNGSYNGPYQHMQGQVPGQIPPPPPVGGNQFAQTPGSHLPPPPPMSNQPLPPGRAPGPMQYRAQMQATNLGQASAAPQSTPVPSPPPSGSYISPAPLPTQQFYGTVGPLAGAVAGNLMSSLKQSLPQQLIQQTILQTPFGNQVGALVNNASARQMAPGAEDEEEGPLLEELGIVPRDILRRMLCVVTFKRVGDDLVTSMDMTGPVLILLGLGCALLMSGKVHFEYVYALMTGGTLGIWALLNLIAKQKLLSIHRTISVLGYGLLPILLVSVVMPFLATHSRLYLALIGVLWSTATASRFMEEALDLQSQRFLAAYPILLFYVGFIMITAL